MRLAELAGSPPELAPKRTVAAVGQVAELVLVPADQRGDQQAGKAEVVVRLDGEPHRRDQVLHRERFMQLETIDTGNGDAGREQARDNQRRELAAAADQDEDIPRRQWTAGRGQHRRLPDHLPDPLGEGPGIMTVAE